MIDADLMDATCKEVLRLISNQNNFLDDLLKMPDLLKKSSEDGQQRTDSPRVKNWQATINDEAQKVDKLEMVLAVVGTMKAGKSTTINAIVGAEILPNRNHPMTSLPTLIRHRRGQKEPVLSFPKHQPIKKMVDDIKEKLSSLEHNNQLELVELYKDKDGEELIQSILEGKFHQFKDRYERQENIFKFLKFLNDLMRLAIDSCINVELPIEEYKSIDTLPLIEVEFFHLASENKLTKGSFAILDTPGPNELFLGEELRKVLGEQIERASAVLAIVDYTQLKSQAEGQIRQELASQIDQLDDRLFVLVNKFDQKDSNGMTENEVKRYVAESFMNGRITQERVYPVSARYGYLSNRALYEINQKGCLPDYTEHGWVADFGHEAIRLRWEKKIQNVEIVQDAAQELWENSYFDKPIKEVIVKAASTAALISMQSATAKMLSFGKSLEDFLELRRSALTKSVEDILKLIDAFAKDIQEVEKAEAKADEALQELINNFLEAAQKEYEKVKQKLRVALEYYFQEGKKQEKQELEQKEMLEQLEQQAIQKQRNKIPLLPANIFGTTEDMQAKYRSVQTEPQFNPNNPRIPFDSETKAENFLGQINEAISSIINDSVIELESALTNLSNSLEQTIPQTITYGVGKILDNAKKRFKDEGFLLQFNVPDFESERNDIDFADILRASIEDFNRIKLKTKYREAKGFLRGRVSRFFGGLFRQDDWGYESYEDHQKVYYYVVNIERIKEKILTSLDSSIQELSNNNEVLFNDKLKPLLDNYFHNLKSYLERFRGDLKGSLENHKLSAEEKKKLKQRISELKERAELHRQDVQSIQQNLK